MELKKLILNNINKKLNWIFVIFSFLIMLFVFFSLPEMIFPFELSLRLELSFNLIIKIIMLIFFLYILLQLIKEFNFPKSDISLFSLLCILILFNMSSVFLLKYFPEIFLLVILFMIVTYFYFRESNFSFLFLIIIVFLFPYYDISIFVILLTLFLIYYYIVIFPKSKSIFLGAFTVIFSFFHIFSDSFFPENFLFSNLDSFTFLPSFTVDVFFHNLFGFNILFLFLSLIGIYFSYYFLKKKSLYLIFFHILVIIFSFFSSIFFHYLYIISGIILVGFLLYYILYYFEFTSDDVKTILLVLTLSLFLLSNRMFFENLENKMRLSQSLEYLDDYVNPEKIIITRPYLCNLLLEQDLDCIYEESENIIYLEAILESNEYYILKDISYYNPEVLSEIHQLNYKNIYENVYLFLN